MNVGYVTGQLQADNRNLKQRLSALSLTVDSLEGQNEALRKVSERVQ